MQADSGEAAGAVDACRTLSSFRTRPNIRRVQSIQGMPGIGRAE